MHYSMRISQLDRRKMYSSIKSALLEGINTIPVNVEVDVSMGMPVFDMVGFLASEVREAKERVKTSLHNCGINMPAKRITVNMSPANIKKRGTSFDLPIAVALLVALGVVDGEKCKDYLFFGELNLNGQILPVNGALPIVSDGYKLGVDKFVVPIDNAIEAKLVENVKIYSFKDLYELIVFLNEGVYRDPFSSENIGSNIEVNNKYLKNFSEVNGQAYLKRACIISASGMHNMLLIGPPGAGKTMIAERIPGIMPPLTKEEQLELSKIYSVVGKLKNNTLISERPFREPHHTVSKMGLIGGGMNLTPGEISLAHNGVLFLDEFPEYQKSVIELLREPLENGDINLVRGNDCVTYPSDFLLLAAMNPCNCGYYPDRNKCLCNERDLKRYLSKISKPILDRIDICVVAEQLHFNDIVLRENNMSSEEMRCEVDYCFEIQKYRFRNEDFCHNSQIPSGKLKDYCNITESDERFMADVFEKYQLTGRTYHKILRVARTIADLDKSENIKHIHLAEAVRLRSIACDNKYWGGLA